MRGGSSPRSDHGLSMAVTGLTVVGPAPGALISTVISRVGISVVWSGGGPFNVLYEWSIDAGFTAPLTRSYTGVTSPHTGHPPDDFFGGGTWFIRATVTDTADNGQATTSVQSYTYFDPDLSDRYLSAQANVGYGYEYDAPSGGWGSGGVPHPDGVNDLFGRYLSAQANVTSGQPCPTILKLSSPVADAGGSVTITGVGLVSGDHPADVYDAEVRLYETVAGDAYVVLARTGWTAGQEDTITVTVPVSARSGWVAVAHTVTPSCGGSNRVALAVAGTPADLAAGWWAEIWNVENTTRVAAPLPDVYEAGFEMVAGDEGSGSILLPADHPDLPEIVAADVQRLVKIYQWGRYAYGFLAEEAAESYTDDGAESVRVQGPGPERILTWGRCLWADYPAQPTVARSRIYGSGENLTPWGGFEPVNGIVNGGGEDQIPDPWERVGGGFVRASDAEARTGVGSIRGDVTNVGDGIAVGFRAEGQTFLDVWTKGQPGGTYTIRVAGETGALAESVWTPATGSWTKTTLVFSADGEVRLEIVLTGGTGVRFWVDDAAAYTGLPPVSHNHATITLTRDRVAEGEHALRVDAAAGGWVTGRYETVAGYDYHVTAAVAGPAGTRVRLETRFGGVAQHSDMTLTSGFTRMRVSGTAATSGVESVTVYALTAAVIYIDDITVTVGEPAATVGQILVDVHDQMTSRGTLDFITLGFTPTHDSGGERWAETLAFDVLPEWSLWDLCQKMVGFGYGVEFAPGDWRAGGDTGWTLSIWNPGRVGTDWTQQPDGPVVLPGITDARLSLRPAAETVVYGEGEGGVWSVAETTTTKLAALGRREAYVVNRAARTTPTLYRTLTTRLADETQFTVRIVAGPPVPLYDFWPHDRLTVHLPAAGKDIVARDAYRVAAITFHASDALAQWDVDFGRYQPHSDRVEALILTRLKGRAPAENYTPGTGSISTLGGSPSSAVSGGGPHDHAWPDLRPGDLAGDLGGRLPGPQVVGLRGRQINPAGPSDGDVLVWDDTTRTWTPDTPTTPTTPTTLQIPGWVGRLAVRPTTAHSGDDEFDGAVLDPEWVEVVPSGSQTVVQDAGLLSALFHGQSSRDIGALIRPLPAGISPPIELETAMRILAKRENHTIVGICFTDGATPTSKAVTAGWNHREAQPTMGIREGSMTDHQDGGSSVQYVGPGFGIVYVRLVWPAENQWSWQLSPDGVSWTSLGTGVRAYTMTPTHYGLFWSRWGGGGEPSAVAYDYVRLYGDDPLTPIEEAIRVPLWVTHLAERDDTAHADDDEFRGTVLQYAQDWTATNPSGETTIHVARDVASILFKSQAEGDLAASSKRITGPSAPKTVEVAYRMIADDRYCLFGLHFSNGTDDDSALIGFGPNPSVGKIEYRTGTFDDATFDVHTPDNLWIGGNGIIYLRLTWRANNSWAGSWSADGVSWTDAGASHYGHSLTPTHYGMHWSRWGDGAEPMNAAVEYFRVYDTDLSV